jgi:hypothetical protein
LTRRDLALGLCALSPDTPHAGSWLVLRAQFIFRMYNVSADESLNFSEFLPLVRHCQKVRCLPTDAETVQHAAERLFACENAFTEEQFVHVLGPTLGDIFRLPLFLSAPPPVQPAVAATVQPQPPTLADNLEKWVCAACTYCNFSASARCSMCNEARGLPGPVVPTPIPVIPSEPVSSTYRAALTPDDWLWLDACVALIQASEKSHGRTEEDTTRCVEKLSALLALPKPPLERVISGWLAS